jgi:hypothetical protein
MAEATEGNPIVFFDVTLGGNPGPHFSFQTVWLPLTPHMLLVHAFLSSAHVSVGVKCRFADYGD